MINEVFSVGVKASQNISEGDFLTLDANGFAQKNATNGAKIFGIANTDIDNTSGSDGDEQIAIVRKGRIKVNVLVEDTDSGSGFTAAIIKGDPLYVGGVSTATEGDGQYLVAAGGDEPVNLHVVATAYDALAGSAAADTEGSIEVFIDLMQNESSASRTVLLNTGIVIDSEWSILATGSFALAASSTSKTMVFQVPGLNVGDKVTGFRIVGQGESAGGTATLDADFRKNTKGVAAIADASVGAITQLSITADSAVDEEKIFTTAEVIAADSQYYVLVDGTTAASTDFDITGIEVDVVRTV